MIGETGFLHLNDAGQWPGFDLHDVEIAGGLLRLQAVGPGFASIGVFRGGPVEVLDGLAPWFRLAVSGELPPGSHLQLFTFTSDGNTAPWNPAAPAPFANPGWIAASRDGLDVPILNPPARRLWIGGILRGDGSASPSLSQMRVEWGRQTYAQHLPPIYRADPAARDFLERFLLPEQSVLESLENKIGGLPALFDPWAAPAGEPPSWLSWLAGWLAFPLEDRWTEAETRQFFAQAFSLYRMRGTVEGLRRAIRIYAGVEARIEEPSAETTVWSLGETSVLGFSTRLAPGPLEGAVVGTTAVVDRSHLTTGAEFGAELFEHAAHRFCVHVWCGEALQPGALERVRTVVERDKPAHTAYKLCGIDPRLRVGVQARVGIDTILARGPQPARTGLPLGSGALLPEAEPCIQEGS